MVIAGLSATPAAAADTVTYTGTVDFTGVTAPAHVDITAYADPTSLVTKESMTVLATASVDYSGAAVLPFSLTVPVGSAFYVDFDPSTGAGLASEWWLGAFGQVAGAYPLVTAITEATNENRLLGDIHAVRSGSISVALEYGADEVCVLRRDLSVVECSSDPNEGTNRAFSGLYPGEYVVSAQNATATFKVSVKEGATSEVDFTEGGVIIGKVVDNAGKPLPGVTVDTRGKDSDGDHVSAVTDSNGRYELASIKTGTTYLRVSDGAGGYIDIGGSSKYAPVAVKNVKLGQVTKPAAIVLHRSGEVTATAKFSRKDIGTAYLVKGDKAYAQADIDYSSRKLSFHAKPGTYRLLIIDRNGDREYAEKKLTIRERKTTKLGTVALRKESYSVSGTALGMFAGTVLLHESRDPKSVVVASAKIANDAFVAQSVPKGTYYLQTIDFAGRVTDDWVEVRVDRHVGGIVALTPLLSTVFGSLAFNGKPLVGATIARRSGAPFMYDSSPLPVDAAGRFSSIWYGHGEGVVGVTSPALGTKTPYCFRLNRSVVTFAEFNALAVTGVIGA